LARRSRNEEIVLIQLCFAILMLVGVAALTVDLGIVRLTQVQMQNAADSAALEGLRQRDALGDSRRRLATCQMAAWNFDGSFGSHCQPGESDFEGLGSTAQGEPWLGAGPVVTMNSAGLALNAGQTMDVSASGVYKPVLQSNSGDPQVESGDMVSGCFVAGPVASEAADYSRTDFEPSGSPNCTGPSSSSPSFLVRLRRANGPLDNISDTDPRRGTSSSGPRIPLLFGMGTLVGTVSDPAGVRTSGITVRATAIADSRKALRVGSAAVGRPGATPFAFSSTCWNSLSDGLGVTFTADAFGNITAPGCGAAAGIYYASAPSAQTVGAQLTLTPPGAVLTGPEYMPIYDPVSNRVIGFGRVDVSSSGGAVTIIRTSSALASTNATAVVAGGFGAITATQLATVLAANQNLTGALLAPALVR
jgi:hypothetical protein